MKDDALYLKYDTNVLTREDWREAARLDAQRAAARANAYGRRLTAEKAREIRRRRKWKKSIDARVLMSGFSG